MEFPFIAHSLAEALTDLPKRDEYVMGYRSTEQARYHMRRVCEKAGIPYKAVHALRHSAGTKLMRECRDLDTVARFLGHSQVETSRIYISFSDDSLENSVGNW